MTTQRHVDVIEAAIGHLPPKERANLASAKEHMVRMHNALVLADRNMRDYLELIRHIRSRINFDQQANTLTFNAAEVEGRELNEELLKADMFLKISAQRHMRSKSEPEQ